jgi:YD repeat-containing protein
MSANLMHRTFSRLTRILLLVFLTGMAYSLLAHVPQHSSYNTFTRFSFSQSRTAAVRPSGATDAFGYDGLGNWTTYTNAEGRVYRMAYDALGRPLAATNAANEQVFANRYDPVGNLTNRTDGAGNTVHYAYDELNRLVVRDAFNHEPHEGTKTSPTTPWATF